VTSRTTAKFRKAFQQLPTHVQRKAREAYKLWKDDPYNAALQFKRVHTEMPVYAARVGIGWRALGVKEGDAVVWFWIGSHADYDKLLSQLQRALRGEQVSAFTSS
jgi:hypothetical protein